MSNPNDDELTNIPKISTKQRLVISTLANCDIKISEAAKKLGRSEATLNQHLGKIRKKLGVKTNYAAIKILVLDKQI